MMINETLILLTPFEDCSEHRVLKRLRYSKFDIPYDICYYQPLQKIFSKVILYDYLKRLAETGFKNVNQEVIELVREEHPKYVLWVAFGEYYEIQEPTFATIRQEGTIVMGWFLDDEVRFNYYSKWWAPYIDYFVTNDVEAVPKYRELGAWATQAVSSGFPVARDWSNVEGKYDVSFGGHIRADREQYINALKHRNIPIHLFGADWGRFVPYEEVRDIYATSKINLNFSKTYKYMKWGIKGRMFEVCLAGGFLLTEYFPGIENYFEVDKEIVCFRNKEEMVDKITYYLNHDEERRAIAQAGWKRATGEYSSVNVISRVFREIEEDLAAKNKESNPHPQKLKMPMQIRRRVSDYYCKWGAAFSEENYKGLWKDTLALSIRYYPFNTQAWYHYIIGLLPYSVRIAVFKLYRTLYHKLSFLPFVREIKQIFY